MANREGLKADNRIIIRWLVIFFLSFLQKSRKKYIFQMSESEDDENFGRFNFGDTFTELQIISNA